MKTNFLIILRLCAMAALSYGVMAAAVANPEAGGDTWFSSGPRRVTSATPNAPTILATVTVRCPVRGTLIADADAEFDLIRASQAATQANLAYCISRNSTRFDGNNSHTIGGNGGGTVQQMAGGLQRFDTCNAGQTVTYRFEAYLVRNLSNLTVARRPRLSVIHLRDRY